MSTLVVNPLGKLNCVVSIRLLAVKTCNGLLAGFDPPNSSTCLLLVRFLARGLFTVPFQFP